MPRLSARQLLHRALDNSDPVQSWPLLERARASTVHRLLAREFHADRERYELHSLRDGELVRSWRELSHALRRGLLSKLARCSDAVRLPAMPAWIGVRSGRDHTDDLPRREPLACRRRRRMLAVRRRQISEHDGRRSVQEVLPGRRVPSACDTRAGTDLLRGDLR